MYVKVRVTAGSRKEKIEKVTEVHYNLWVREPAEQNRANQRVIEIIRELFSMVRGEVKIIAGHWSPSKIISIQFSKNEDLH